MGRSKRRVASHSNRTLGTAASHSNRTLRPAAWAAIGDRVGGEGFSWGSRRAASNLGGQRVSSAAPPWSGDRFCLRACRHHHPGEAGDLARGTGPRASPTHPNRGVCSSRRCEGTLLVVSSASDFGVEQREDSVGSGQQLRLACHHGGRQLGLSMTSSIFVVHSHILPYRPAC